MIKTNIGISTFNDMDISLESKETRENSNLEATLEQVEVNELDSQKEIEEYKQEITNFLPQLYEILFENGRIKDSMKSFNEIELSDLENELNSREIDPQKESRRSLTLKQLVNYTRSNLKVDYKDEYNQKNVIIIDYFGTKIALDDSFLKIFQKNKSKLKIKDLNQKNIEDLKKQISEIEKKYEHLKPESKKKESKINFKKLATIAATTATICMGSYLTLYGIIHYNSINEEQRIISQNELFLSPRKNFQRSIKNKKTKIDNFLLYETTDFGQLSNSKLRELDNIDFNQMFSIDKNKYQNIPERLLEKKIKEFSQYENEFVLAIKNICKKIAKSIDEFNNQYKNNTFKIEKQLAQKISEDVKQNNRSLPSIMYTFLTEKNVSLYIKNRVKNKNSEILNYKRVTNPNKLQINYLMEMTLNSYFTNGIETAIKTQLGVDSYLDYLDSKNQDEIKLKAPKTLTHLIQKINQFIILKNKNF